MVKDEIFGTGERTQLLVVDPRIDALNREWSAGRLELGEGRRLMEALKAEYGRPQATSFAEYNLDLAERYIAEAVEFRRSIREGSRRSARAGVRRVVEKLGQRSLRIMSARELQDVADAVTGAGRNRHFCLWLNALLKFSGRQERVRVLRQDYKPPVYLTVDEYRELVDAVEDPVIRALVVIMYNTGARLSEALALGTSDIGRIGRDVVVRIERQYVQAALAVGEDDRLRAPKNRKSRMVVPLDWRVVKDALTVVERAHPTIEEREIYRSRVGSVIARECARLFGRGEDDGELQDFGDDREYRRCHMLRAGFAVRLLELGVDMGKVAKQLGDSITVTERHYGGFVNDKASVGAIARLINK